MTIARHRHGIVTGGAWTLLAVLAATAACAGGGPADDAGPGGEVPCGCQDAALPDPGLPDAPAPDPAPPDPGPADLPGDRPGGGDDAPDGAVAEVPAPDPGTPDPGTPDPGVPDLPVPDPGAPDPGPGDEGLPPPVLGRVSPADLKAEMEAKDFLLINVHVPYDGQIPGTDRHLTYLDPDAIAAFVGPDPSRKVVVYCLSNYMSLISGKDLVARGYRAVRYLDGGMAAWKAAGYPFEE